MKRMLMVAAVAAAMTTAAGCSSMKNSMPDWMPGSSAMKVSLTGAQENPPVSTAATGSGSFRVADDGTISGSVTTQGMQGTMAHIHQASTGQNGPVIVPLQKNGDTYSVPADKKLTSAQIDALKAGNLYVNVHSDKHKGGEIRAQLQP